MDEEQRNIAKTRPTTGRWIEKAPHRAAAEASAPPRLPSWARRAPSRFNTYQMTWSDA
jgi:hypothetical protein